jgi:hypothetical protein
MTARWRVVLYRARVLFVLLGIAALVILVLYVRSCDPNKRSDLELYFGRLGPTFGQENDLNRINRDFEIQRVDAEGQERTAAYAAYFEGFARILRDYHVDLLGVSPPEVAADAHATYLRVVSDLAQAMQDIADGLREVVTWDEAQGIIFANLIPALRELDDICREFQELAEQEGVSYDEKCLDLPTSTEPFALG